MCSFCNSFEEEIVHFIWECKITHEFIMLAKNFLDSIVPFCVQETSWTLENIIFNSVHRKSSSIYNFLVLVMKYYIYCCRCAKSRPNIHQFKNRILEIRNIEKYNAIVNGNLDKHNKKMAQY